MATWFISTLWSQSDSIRQIYMGGHEVADHTIAHVALPNVSEIIGARLWLNQVQCGA